MKKLFTLIIAFTLCSYLFAQEIGTAYTPVVSQSAYFDISEPIRDIAIPPQGANAHHQWKGKVVENKFMDKKLVNPAGALPVGEDPSWQKDFGEKGITAPIQNFEGTRNSDNGAPAEWVSPPDTDGDVGPNHYFQMCNLIFQIFNKSGASLLGPLDNSTIWAGFVGPWTGTNDGDPIILYDEQADRWLVSQFAVNTTNGTYWELVAISTTGDPTGSYYRYAFQFTSFPDYPKFGIWRDGYYIMVQHGTAAGNVTAASFNRTQMIAGNPTAQMVSFPMPNLPGGGFIGMLPSDNDGQWAPVGAPNYFMYFSDDAWGDDPVDRLKVWEFHVNWTTPALSTLTLTTNLNTTAFDSYFGSFSSGWITQPGTTQKLATMEGALMNRLQYRNFGTYQSMLCCHTVDVNGSNRAGVRWYELRKTTGAWSIYQQGTYSPGTTDNYWMASIAQNGDGDIALGFSVSSGSTYPSIRYTGRNYGDALGVMTLTEQNIYAGTVSQYGTHRWGDYTMMSVDPIDDKSFWYTNEYINSGSWSDWVTRIASFSLGNYCAAGGGCDEYISNVQIGTINNSTGCNSYADYTNISTNVPVNSSASLSVTNGVTSYPTDQCGVWVDWNNDGVFSAGNETITVAGTPGVGPYTATIAPPVGTALGAKTMRIRITYNAAPLACGTTTYGEVEDYTINVSTAVANVWDGSFNQYWHNAANWSLNHIPTADEPVQIPNVGLQPVLIDFYDEACLDLTLGTGATLNIYDQALTVNGVMTISGTLGTLQDNATINAMSDVTWNSGSSWNGTAYSAYINVYGNWNFNTGANVNPAQGFVDFKGAVSNWIRCYSSSSSFSILRIYKTGGAAAKVSNLSTNDLVINGLTFINSGAIFQSWSNFNIVMKGTFNYYGTFDFTQNSNTGSVIFDGSTQGINNYSSGSGTFNNVVFTSSVGTTVASGDLAIAKNLTIEQGNFSSGSVNITIGGNWTNSVGASGYTPGTGTVLFHGLIGPNQDVYGTNTFNNIIQDNTGQFLRLHGNTTILGNLELHYFCWAYNTMNINGTLNINDAASKFTSNEPANVTVNALDQGGSLVVNGVAVLTVNDLLDNGIVGKHYVNTAGGVLNLTNSGTGLYVDLSGELHNFGGTINITGNVSYWPYNSNAVVEMTGGVIDLKTCGLTIYNSATYSLTDNITGGTIRTASYFSGGRADFTPTAGTFEFYGPNDSYISQSNGCTVYNVNINKSADDGMNNLPPVSVIDERSGEEMSDGGKANTINLNSNFSITNNLTVTAGTLNIGAYTLTVAKTSEFFGGLVMTDPAGVFNNGTVLYDNLWFRSGSSANLIAGNINIKSWIAVDAGSSFSATNGNTIHIIGANSSGGIGNSAPPTVFGNIEINKSVTSPSYCASDYTGPYNISGNLTIQANNVFKIGTNTMHVYGLMTDQSTSSVYLNYTDKSGDSDASPIGKSAGKVIESGSKGGSLTIDTDYTLNGLLDVSDGNVLLHGGLTIASTGILNITTGFFIADKPYYAADAFQYLNGTINLSAGLFEISHNSMRFSSTSVNNISGGTVRCGFTFYATDANVYKPTGGVTEFTGNDPSCYIQCNNGNWFNDFTVSRGSMIELASDITVKGSVNIVSGPLNTMSIAAVQYNMYVGGNWNNTGGPTAFNEGTGTVFFNGTGALNHQFINGNETFYNIENAKSGGGYLRFNGNINLNNNFLANGTNIVDGPTLGINNLLLSTGEMGLTTAAPNVNVSNFTMGGVLSVTNGSFICTDVTNNGIFGTINLVNGAITLNQDAGHYSDLNANLTINGGYMAVNNGNGGSVWGWGSPCIITMTNGVLDFNNNGIYMDNTYSVTESITGGTIKTNLAFSCGNTNFTPTGGTIELYGGTDSYIQTVNSSNVFNLLINKSGGDKGLSKGNLANVGESAVNELSLQPEKVLQSSKNNDRPKMPTGSSKANLIYTGGPLKVNGTTTVEEGTFLVDNYVATCMGNINVNAGGKLAIGDFGALAVENGKILSVNTGGFLDLTGSVGGAATITHNSGYYALNVESGGTIGGIYGIFEYMNNLGVNIKNGALVDVLKPFNYCTFRNGQAAGTLMTIENNQTFYVENAVFPTNTWTGAYNVTKAVNAGMVYFVTATGGFAGESYDNDVNNRIMWTNRSLSLKAYLEGPFNGTNMNTTLNGILPLSHPFNPTLPYFGNPVPDWYYTGAGSVGAIPNVNIVDWILIEIRDAINAANATPATSVAKFPAFILNNGNIVSLDGASSLQFSNPIVNNLFVVVYNRNHQRIMNANIIPYSSGSYNYDYTTGAAQVYGGVGGHKELSPGVWGMRSGDGNADGNTTILDKTAVWGLSTQLGKTGYLPSDFNFDRQTNNKDKNDKWVPNLGTGSQVP